jgi:hypothetical protein
LIIKYCNCSASVVGCGRSPLASINSLLAPLFSSLILRSSIAFFFLSLLLQQTMARGRRGRGWPCRGDNKCKVSSESNRSPALASPPSSSEDSDDSMGLSTAARAYWRSIERAGLGGSDESGVSSDEADSSDSSEEWSSGLWKIILSFQVACLVNPQETHPRFMILL